MCILSLVFSSISFFVVFFFNDTATTEIYTLSLHDALPILASYLFYAAWNPPFVILLWVSTVVDWYAAQGLVKAKRSEEHTSELQSHSDLVCRLLLEKKKNNYNPK